MWSSGGVRKASFLAPNIIIIASATTAIANTYSHGNVHFRLILNKYCSPLRRIFI